MAEPSPGRSVPPERELRARELRQELEAVGFRPTKGRGQNFLVDPNLARAIVADAGVQAGDRVLEVGPGCGFLTVPLAALDVDLLAVEIDPRLAEIARRRVGANPRVRFVLADVLAGKHALAGEVADALWSEGDWHLVANLPYAITGPLLVLLATGSNPPATMTVLVQNEVADRLVARPGTRAWGGLTVRMRLRYRARAGRSVPAHLFWPRPRVESRVVHLERDRGVELMSEEEAGFDRLVEGLFRQRRKTVRASLGAIVGGRAPAEAALAEASIDPESRPEELEPRAFLALLRALPSPPGGPGGASRGG
jgi:16S rRNA (adenine1518-N6/adenine1519-N6)-dimethyltransferase